MKIHIFQSGPGDCLMIEGSTGGRVLVDGGMDNSNWDHIAPTLAALEQQGQAIDAIYVSHIDSDHIGGIMRLLDQSLAWKVFDFHEANPPNDTTPPPFDRPPEIHGIWHNAFHHLITRNRGKIQDLLAANAPVFIGSAIAKAVEAGEAMANIATSVPQAMRVSQLIQPDLLGIPLNQPPGRPDPGELLLIEDPNDPFPVGSMNFSLVGPTPGDLRKLRKGWDNWLRDNENREESQEIRAEMQKRIEDFAAGTAGDDPFDLSSWNGVPNFENVTVPNTASLMFLVEDDGHTALFTGDSQQDIILDNLEDCGHLDAHGAIHVDVLKIAHHGSKNNTDENFCRHVTADHYVFCGNGGHGNPNPNIVEMYFNSRAGTAAQRAVSAEAQDDSRPFTFWFSTTSGNVSGPVSRKHFEETEAKVAELQQKSPRLQAKFNEGAFIVLPSADAPLL